MDKIYRILIAVAVLGSFLNICLNLRKLFTRNSSLENLSKRKLLNSAIIRGLYTFWLFGVACWFSNNFESYDEDFLMHFLTVLFTASAVEAFTAFLIPCRELMRKSNV